MRRAGAAGETGLEAMASASRPPGCPRSAPVLRGRFFLPGKRRESMPKRWRPKAPRNHVA